MEGVVLFNLGRLKLCASIQQVLGIERLIGRDLGEYDEMGNLIVPGHGPTEIINISEMLGETMKIENFRILVSDTGKKKMGLVVDRIVGAIKLSKEEIHPLPYIFQGTLLPAFKGFVKVGDDIFLLIDLGRLYEEFTAKS